MEYVDMNDAIAAGVPMIVVRFDPKTGEETSCDRYNLENVSLSKWQVESLARALLPAVQEFYTDPENVRKFEEWKAHKDGKNAECIG